MKRAVLSHPFFFLSSQQKAYRKSILKKLNAGKYCLIENKCICRNLNDGQDRLLAHKDRYGLPHEVAVCIACGLIFSKKKFDRDSAKKFYEDDYRGLFENKKATPESIFQRQKEKGREILRLCQQMKDQDRPWRVLDIGCNSGGHLKPFLDLGCNVSGVDWDGRYFDFAKQKGLHGLSTGGIFEVDADSQQYDVIIMSHVLEHLDDPVKALGQVSKLLDDDGLFYVEVPNIDPLDKEELYLELQIAHNWYFDQFNLEEILSKAGLKAVFTQKPFHLCVLAQKGLKSTTEIDLGQRILSKNRSIDNKKLWRELMKYT